MVESNALIVAAELEAIFNSFPAAIESALDRIGIVIKQDVEREIQQTYSRPIPSYGAYYQPKSKYRAGTNLSSPAWERSGNLIEGVSIDKRDGERRVFISGPAGEPISGYPGGYAQRLGDLPDGPDGVNRSNPFFERAVEKHEEQWIALFEQDVYERAGL